MAGLWIAAVTAGCGGEESPSVELALAAERSGSGRPVASAPDRLAPRPVARRPQAIAVTPDGLKAYVASERDLRVTVLDAVSHRILKEVTLGPARGRPELPVVVAVDPEGRHLFHVDPLRRTIAVLETSSDTHVASIPVPEGSRDIAFDFSGGSRRVFVTNQRDNAVLVFLEAPAGVFSAQPAFSLAGRGPDPIAVVPGGQLLVGHRHSHELEVVDTSLPPDNATVARIPLGSLPLDVAVSGTRALVPTFTPTPGLLGPNDGRNELLEVDLVSAQVVGAHLVDLGTDYSKVLESAQHVVVLGSGSGSVLIADPLTLALFERIDLAPGDPVAHPVDIAFIPPPGGGTPSGLFVVNEFRETVRPVDLSAGPPFSLQSEIGLGTGRSPRLPLIDLSSAEDGEWFFETVAFFNGTATNPNNVTCATCHPGAGSDGLNHLGSLRQAGPGPALKSSRRRVHHMVHPELQTHPR